MKKIILLLVLCVVLSGCSYRLGPKIVHATDIQKVDLGSGKMKRGRACQTWFLFPLFSFGWDVGMVKAAQNGGIRRIMLQEESFDYFLFGGRICNDVYGE